MLLQHLPRPPVVAAGPGPVEGEGHEGEAADVDGVGDAGVQREAAAMEHAVDHSLLEAEP